jgi:hypothetical protein
MDEREDRGFALKAVIKAWRFIPPDADAWHAIWTLLAMLNPMERWLDDPLVEMFTRDAVMVVARTPPVVDPHNAPCSTVAGYREVAAAIERMRILAESFEPGECDSDCPWCHGSGELPVAV